MLDFNQLFPLFASLVGFPAFVAAGVNVAKYVATRFFNTSLDDLAPKIVFWVNVVGFVGVGVAYFTGNLPLLSQIDAQLGSLATALLSLLAFLIDLGLPKVFNAGLRGMPVIGKSYSLEAEKFKAPKG